MQVCYCRSCIYTYEAEKLDRCPDCGSSDTRWADENEKLEHIRIQNELRAEETAAVNN